MPAEVAFTLIGLAVIVFIFRFGFVRITVFEFEKGLLYTNGRFRRILDPGRHWLWAASTSVTKIDMRPRFATLAGQQVLSADGVTLSVSLAAKYQVTDPYVAVNKIQDYQSALYLELQLALREIIGSTKIDDALAKRNEIGKQLMDLTAEKVSQIGLSLLSVDIKDIMFPGELKKIFAQVVKAQKEGLAVLEKARGETAALRNLTNAAKLIEENPALMQLRLLQHLGETPGNTLVLGVPPSAAPLPIREKPIELPKPPESKAPGSEE